MIAGDDAVGIAQITLHGLELAERAGQIGLRLGQVSFDAAHIGLDAGDIVGNGSHLLRGLLLGRGQLLSRGFIGLFTANQGLGALIQLFLGEAERFAELVRGGQLGLLRGQAAAQHGTPDEAADGGQQRNCHNGQKCAGVSSGCIVKFAHFYLSFLR